MLLKTQTRCKDAQKTPFSYLKNGLSYELHLPLVLIRIAMFHNNISILNSKGDSKTPKTTENCQKTPYRISRETYRMNFIYSSF